MQSRIRIFSNKIQFARKVAYTVDGESEQIPLQSRHACSKGRVVKLWPNDLVTYANLSLPEGKAGPAERQGLCGARCVRTVYSVQVFSSGQIITPLEQWIGNYSSFLSSFSALGSLQHPADPSNRPHFPHFVRPSSLQHLSVPLISPHFLQSATFSVAPSSLQHPADPSNRPHFSHFVRPSFLQHFSVPTTSPHL